MLPGQGCGDDALELGGPGDAGLLAPLGGPRGHQPDKVRAVLGAHRLVEDPEALCPGEAAVVGAEDCVGEADYLVACALLYGGLALVCAVDCACGGGAYYPDGCVGGNIEWTDVEDCSLG